MGPALRIRGRKGPKGGIGEREVMGGGRGGITWPDLSLSLRNATGGGYF